MKGQTKTRALPARLEEWRRQAGVAFASAAVRAGGQLLWSGSAGEPGGADSAALPAHARFPIYSITKTFTAICLLGLEEEGRLDAEGAVADWFPEPSLPERITLARLLRHTSGLRDYGGLGEYRDAVKARPSTPWTDREFFDATLPRGLLFEPGTGWAYSNVGYLVLRRVIERAAGISFRRCVEQRISSRLGLADTFIAEAIEDWSSCVPGYGGEVRPDGGVVDVRSTYHPGWCAPGVAVSTAEDVTRIYQALFAGELLDASRLARMLQLTRVPGSHPPAITPSYGMGLAADPDGPFGPSYGHGGGGPGYSLSASILPRSPGGSLSIALFCNSSLGADARDGAHQVLRAALR